MDEATTGSKLARTHPEHSSLPKVLGQLVFKLCAERLKRVGQNSITSGNQQKGHLHEWDPPSCGRALQRLVVNRNPFREETILGVARVRLEDGPARPSLFAFKSWLDSHYDSDAAVAGTDEAFSNYVSANSRLKSNA